MPQAMQTKTGHLGLLLCRVQHVVNGRADIVLEYERTITVLSSVS